MRFVRRLPGRQNRTFRIPRGGRNDGGRQGVSGAEAGYCNEGQKVGSLFHAGRETPAGRELEMAANRIRSTARAVWLFFRRPSARWSPGAILLAGVAAGAPILGGYNEAVVQTNKMSFCISCHEMRDFVYRDYVNSVRYRNPVGSARNARTATNPATGGTGSKRRCFRSTTSTTTSRERFRRGRSSRSIARNWTPRYGLR